MKRLALLDSTHTVITVAAWDGVSPYNPVAAGLCASTQDATSNPQVGPGWTYSAGTWIAPAPVITPDPDGFVTAVAGDSSLATATRLAAVNSLASLSAAVDAGNTALITGTWDLMIAQYAISSADQSAVHSHALAYGIAGI